MADIIALQLAHAAAPTVPSISSLSLALHGMARARTLLMAPAPTRYADVLMHLDAARKSVIALEAAEAASQH